MTDQATAAANLVRNYQRDASFDDSTVGQGEHHANQCNIADAIEALPLPATAAMPDEEQIARVICYWDEPTTCHDAYCIGKCIAVRPNERFFKTARAVLALSAPQRDGWRPIETASDAGQRVVTYTICIDRDGNVYNDTQTHGSSFAAVYKAFHAIKDEVNRQIAERRNCPENPKFLPSGAPTPQPHGEG